MTTTANIPVEGDPLFYAGTTHQIWGLITEAGNPKDITDASIVWILAVDADTTPLVVKTTPTQITIPDPTGGLFIVYLEGGDTATLGGHTYYHEARAAIDETQEVVFAGTITITQSDTVGLV
jgi:hypothetical protein